MNGYSKLYIHLGNGAIELPVEDVLTPSGCVWTTVDSYDPNAMEKIREYVRKAGSMVTVNGLVTTVDLFSTPSNHLIFYETFYETNKR